MRICAISLLAVLAELNEYTCAAKKAVNEAINLVILIFLMGTVQMAKG